MKNHLIHLSDKLLLRKLAILESIIDQLRKLGLGKRCLSFAVFSRDEPIPTSLRMTEQRHGSAGWRLWLFLPSEKVRQAHFLAD